MGFGGDDDDDVTHLRPNSGNRLVSNQMFSNIRRYWKSSFRSIPIDNNKLRRRQLGFSREKKGLVLQKAMSSQIYV